MTKSQLEEITKSLCYLVGKSIDIDSSVYTSLRNVLKIINTVVENKYIDNYDYRVFMEVLKTINDRVSHGELMA